jgi:hypothetical protein
VKGDGAAGSQTVSSSLTFIAAMTQSNTKPPHRASFSPALFVGEKVPKADEGVLSTTQHAILFRQSFTASFLLMNAGEASVGIIGNARHPPSAPSPPLKSAGAKALDVWFV